MEKSLHFLDWLVWNFYWYYINELVDKHYTAVDLY